MNTPIHPKNLLIVENSPYYNQDLLASEREGDDKFLNTMNQSNGAEMLKHLLGEQLKIFENTMKYNYPLKYFTNTIKQSQVDAFKLEISRSYTTQQDLSAEEEVYNDEENLGSFEVEDDNIDPQVYTNALIDGINAIESVQVFRFLDFGIETPPDYFDNRELDEIKEDYIDFVNKLTPSQTRQIYKANPVLTSDSVMNSLLNKMSLFNDSLHDSNNEIFFQDQNKKSDSSLKEEENIKDRFKYFAGKSRSTNKIIAPNRDEKSEETMHPLEVVNPKTISSIGQFTQTENNEHENSLEDLNNEIESK